jgi:hypothetical protein
MGGKTEMTVTLRGLAGAIVRIAVNRERRDLDERDRGTLSTGPAASTRFAPARRRRPTCARWPRSRWRRRASACGSSSRAPSAPARSGSGPGRLGVREGARLSCKGRTAPALRKARLEVQRFAARGGWRRVGKVKTNNRGRFGFTLRLRTVGNWTVRSAYAATPPCCRRAAWARSWWWRPAGSAAEVAGGGRVAAPGAARRERIGR